MVCSKETTNLEFVINDIQTKVNEGKDNGFNSLSKFEHLISNLKRILIISYIFEKSLTWAIETNE